MNVLVTGGCGFIGSNFVNYVMRRFPDWNVRVLDRLTYAGSLERIELEHRRSGRFTFMYGDVLDRRLVERAVEGIDVVVHYAAESHVAYSFTQGDLFADVNVRGTSILCETIVQRPVERFIHISSSEVYGNMVRDEMDEDHPLNPRSPYAGSKAAADRLAYSYHIAFDLPLVIIRPFNNYGAFQHTEKVIPRFIQSALQGEPIEIHDDGLQTRDWLHVEDHAEAIAAVIRADLKKVKGEVLNLGTGVEVSIREIAEKVAAQLGRPEALALNNYQRPGQVRRQRSSTAKAAERLGWKARTSFDRGLEQTIQWYSRNRTWWQELISPAILLAKPIGRL